VYLEYSPNNSGGSFWHTDKQWQELIDLGWVDLGWRIIKQFPSFQDGMNEWQSMPGAIMLVTTATIKAASLST